MSNQLPFLTEEWGQVTEAGRQLCNASLMDDEVLAVIKRDALFDLLAELRMKYGDHPVLIETEADFTPDRERQFELYDQAIVGAVALGFPTYTIRISLASLLLKESDDHEPPPSLDVDIAYEQLLLCEDEMEAHADEWDREQWARLVESCKRQRR